MTAKACPGTEAGLCLPGGPVAIRGKAWAKRIPEIPAWATPRSWLSRSEAAAVLGGVPRSTLHRLAQRGEGPPCDDQSFTGNAVRYRLVNLLAWWGAVTGNLPSDVGGVWEWWLEETPCLVF